MLPGKFFVGIAVSTVSSDIDPIVEIPIADWNQRFPAKLQEHAVKKLEQGSVLFFPQLGFGLDEAEARFLSPAVVKSKNISFDPSVGKLGGSRLEEAETEDLKVMMRRFSQYSRNLLLGLLPLYGANLVQARTSFRPVEVKGRSISWRKDDTRLHVDSFPATPVQDKRILRIFCNINPEGSSRTWKLGEPFERVAGRFVPRLSRPSWPSSRMLHWSGITKSRRSEYDHLMLQLHDHMKADSDYQADAEQLRYDFPVGSTWMVFTDQVPHAVVAGQHVLEQTFYLPVDDMAEPSRSPLRVLEDLTSRQLV